ncbi:MmgE/PrpD family protein [Nocardioides halotolerans]|uniref:MmgE/PrpD family protein n=1 Tax=Nocardioides halotolerans TaxID=433660 RepID=UPI0003FA1B46|nr:MmgE/PrpD family protein [Nocardioides halotolerans]
MTRTRELASWAAGIAGRPEGAVPEEARRYARAAFVDTVGVMLAGVAEPACRLVRGVALTPVAAGPATVAGTALRSSAADAALANATAAHALDFDDTHQSVRGHPSAVLVPALLAIGEERHASGPAAVTAYAVGLEVAGLVGVALGGSHAARGFHSSSVLGVLGAAAGCAALLGLDAERTERAWGIAASGASGLRRAFGTMTKPLHAGEAARRGLLAAVLAERGFTGPVDVLDGAQSFLDAYTPDAGASALAWGRAGDGWQVVSPGLAVKKYACCNRGHRALDAALFVREELGRPPADQIAGVEVWMPAGQVGAAGEVGPMIHPDPATGLEAKFSMPYVVACALFDGRLGTDAFSDEAVRRPGVRELMRRVRVASDPARPTEPGDHVEVVVELRDRSRARCRVEHPRGDPRTGARLGEDEVAAKFRDCARPVLADRTDAVLDGLGRLDELADVADLVRGLAGAP